MAVGNLEVTVADKARINNSVTEAELLTGLEFCVAFTGDHGGEPRKQAERAFHKLGLHLRERPAVMFVVSKSKRTLEVVTAPGVADGRLTDADCEQAVDLMTGPFASGDFAGGIEIGLRSLVKLAGPPADGDTTRHHGTDLPNVIDTGEIG